MAETPIEEFCEECVNTDDVSDQEFKKRVLQLLCIIAGIPFVPEEP